MVISCLEHPRSRPPVPARRGLSGYGIETCATKAGLQPVLGASDVSRRPLIQRAPMYTGRGTGCRKKRRPDARQAFVDAAAMYAGLILETL